MYENGTSKSNRLRILMSPPSWLDARDPRVRRCVRRVRHPGRATDGRSARLPGWLHRR